LFLAAHFLARHLALLVGGFEFAPFVRLIAVKRCELRAGVHDQARELGGAPEFGPVNLIFGAHTLGAQPAAGAFLADRNHSEARSIKDRAVLQVGCQSAPFDAILPEGPAF